MLKKILSLFRGPRRRASKSPAQAPSASLETPIRVKRPIPERDLDPDAVKIVRRLVRHGHEAYLVGGCVRDLLVGGHPKDFDIGTSATPGQLKRLFRNSRIIGRRFRLAHIYFRDRKVIEVATFRSLETAPAEGSEQGDLLIRDDNVFGTPAEDAVRRDFTINGLFYDVHKQMVIDHTNGLEDLKRRTVRTIGDPAVRLREDPIRILRAIKFAARLDFHIEKQTLAAIQRYGNEIIKSAAPRVLEEIYRYCREGAAVRSMELLRETGVLGVILPELSEAYHDERNWKALCHLLRDIDRRKPPRIESGESLAVLLLPLMFEPFGWRPDGTLDESKRPDIRALSDRWLGPIGQRLRLARRDQEVCRLLLLSLVRMAHPQLLRRRTKQAILRRSCYPEALRLLESLAEILGGEFATALDYWRRSEQPATREQDPQEASDEEQTAPRRRRRGSRGGARRRPQEGTDDKPAAEKPASRPKDERPKKVPLDFFAALPSAPTDERETSGDADRYGGDQFGEQEEGSTEEGPAEDRPRRRRRRRRRRPANPSESNDDDGVKR